MDRDSDRRDPTPARRRSFAEESARSLRQRHQLVEGVGTMTPHFRGPVVPASRQLSQTSFGKSALALLLMSTSMLAGCSHLQKLPEIALDDPADPAARVNQANAAARVQPVRNGFINAVQVYPFTGGALYQVYTAPGQITDVALQAGEQLTGSGPVAAGDTVRWIIGDTESETGAAKKVHILIKPTRPDLVTNLVINTDRRTYFLELRSTEKTYMASVSWQYPEDQLIALRRQNAAAVTAAPIDAGIDVSKLRFRYVITGDNPPWRPLSAFDDGSKVYIEMPRGIAQGEAPPLFVIGPEGDGQLVNYLVRQNYYIVDRLFGAAELRLGGEHQQTVRISRTDGRLW